MRDFVRHRDLQANPTLNPHDAQLPTLQPVFMPHCMRYIKVAMDESKLPLQLESSARIELKDDLPDHVTPGRMKFYRETLRFGSYLA
ncbi:MAG: hypothetical protein FJ267_09165 [Planctomycetes bacterium]|nr:hypothetical protein [Planctomycetota bacterium]